MKDKIIGIIVCMLMIAASLPAVGAIDNQNALPATSTIIGIKIIATVTQVTDSYNLLGGAIHVNDTITGKYIYNTEILDSNPDPNVGVYVHISSPYGVEVNAGGFVFKTDPNNVYFIINILNDYGPYGYSPIDEYLLGSLNNLPLSNGLLVTGCEFSLVDTTATALSSTDLPTKAPVLTNWNSGQGLFIEGKNPSNPDQKYRILAHVTKATTNNAIDIIETESGTPSMTIPYHYYIPFMQIWLKLFQQFPNAFPILRYLLGCYE